MTARRQLSAGVLVTLAGALSLTVYLYWQQIMSAALLFVAGRYSMHYLRRRLGIKSRPKSSWSSLIRSGSIAFAAWNTRWFKPKQPVARITKRTDGEPAPIYDPFTGEEIGPYDNTIPF